MCSSLGIFKTQSWVDWTKMLHRGCVTFKQSCWIFQFIWKSHFPLWKFCGKSNAAFRLACRSPHCRFDGDFCTAAQAPLAAEGWPSSKQCHANRSITLPLCPPRQIADSWILFNSGAMLLGDKAKAAWLLRAATLKQQAMITRRSGKLVWNQHYIGNVWVSNEVGHSCHFQDFCMIVCCQSKSKINYSTMMVTFIYRFCSQGFSVIFLAGHELPKRI